MSSEQLLVLVLLAAAFAAGWLARGGRGEAAPAGAAFDDEVPPPPAMPAAPPDQAVIAEAGAVLERAISAARAARSVALGPAGASEAATQAVLGVLDRRIAELEDCADRLEAELGPDDLAFAAYDRAVSGLHSLRRRVDGDTALGEVEAAHAAWTSATLG